MYRTMSKIREATSSKQVCGTIKLVAARLSFVALSTKTRTAYMAGQKLTIGNVH